MLSATVNGQSTKLAVEKFHANEKQEAIRILLELAYDNNIAAQFNLGVIHHGIYKETGSAIDKAESLYWFEKAANAEDLSAQFNLGMLAVTEADTNNPENIDLDWLKQSAQGGNINAQTNLGILGLWGNIGGTTENSSVGWLEQAKGNGDSVATSVLQLWQSAADSNEGLALLHELDTTLRENVERDVSVVFAESASVYALPSSRQEPLLTLPKDSRVGVIGQRSGWLNVSLSQGLPSWIQSQLVKKVPGGVEIVSQDAGIFVAPKLDVEVFKIGTAYQGEILSLLSERNGWVEVSAPLRVTAWMREVDIDIRVSTVPINSSEVADTKSAERESPVPENVDVSASTNETLAAKSTLVNQSGSNGQQNVTNASVQKASDNGGGGSILSQELGVFNSPASTAKKLGFLPAGTKVDYGSKINQFVAVNNSPVHAWIFHTLVAVRGTQGTINTNGARLRLAPTTSSQIVGQLTQGYQVGVVEDKGDWVQVSYILDRGWVKEIAQGAGENRLSADVSNSQSLQAGASLAANSLVYSEPRTSSSPIGRLLSANNEKSQENRNGFSRLKDATAIYGWVYASLLKESGNLGQINRNGVRVRYDPDTSKDNVISTANAGDQFKIIARKNDWYQIEMPASVKWVIRR